jgi:dTDP-4-dehydrorhamnose 3,5-epimerase
MIEGVTVKDLTVHADERGFLWEILRSDWPEFKKFGQCYVSTVYPGAVKGWHYHKRQTDHFCVVKGMARITLYDRREDSPTRHELMEVVMGDYRRRLLIIPPEVLHGMVSLTQEIAYVINVPDQVYNYEKPDEERVPYDAELTFKDGTKGPYDWRVTPG